MFKITTNGRHDGTQIDFNGKPFYAQSLDMQFRPDEKVKVLVEAYVSDLNSGTLVKSDENGDAITETMTFYCCSQEEYEFLQKRRAESEGK